MRLPLLLPALALLSLPLSGRAQSPGVGIGTTTPDAAAALEIVASGTAKGLLIPRLTAAERTAITNPPQGLMVYQTDGSAGGGPQTGFWYYAGTPAAWVYLSPTGDNLGNHTATQPLNLQANALTGTGASIGTAVGVGVRADGGLNIGQNTTGNTVAVGYGAGQNTTGGNNTLLGYYAGNKLTTGTYNVFIGNAAAYNNALSITGSNNVVVGSGSGANLTSNTNNILLGGNAQASSGLYDAYAIGTNATVSQGNSLVIGNVRGTNDAVSVGIGTMAPSSSLHVNGTFAVGVVTNFGGGTSGGPNGFDQGAANSSTVVGGYFGLAPGSNSNYYVLPNPASCPGRVYYLRNNSTSTSAFLLTAAGSIFGASSTSAVSSSAGYELKPTVASKTVIAISDGTNWTVGSIN